MSSTSDPKLVREARSEEVQHLEKTKVSELASWEECLQNTGRPPTMAKW